ncbi:glycerol-3-phosphate dehydrogenase/oxidase [Yeosuana sp. MJ-SS3]|uniref:Glycerol-3-phosphate dehydrogenase/oxidase n=1 Tax=Gilvirhabdus luticola TaxID=3079858 RepID=A0ABU3U3Z0_9FLAO|nr:glycerol-3-phosphate dehydrogenase/oxidase [Yeosuana sp. MJ-SS3]MDU8884820.1 glycerol-3-phosphate dehydrogenase/oxidase [Yeosuana sp. MJ-SS3]
MSREEQILKIKATENWDCIIIGGGASGLGIAVDAASRGFKTVLFEGNDFAKGTSSKSTKLVHGGVRYMSQGHIGLVVEALQERGILAENAKHLFRNQSFVIPNYNRWKGYYYAIGLKIYDLLSRNLSLGKSELIRGSKVINILPNLKKANLSNGVVYHDGQFDDSRLAINLAQTAIEQGATILNYFKVIDILKDKHGKNEGVIVIDDETGEKYHIKSKCIINATGIFTDRILKINDPTHKKTVVPSRGIHLVFDKSLLNSNYAIMIPKTTDGRVLFIIPWHDKVLVGTTDTPVKKKTLDPVASKSEINFILQNGAQYFQRPPKKEDILSVFAGLRPLAAPRKNETKTKEVSRNHKIIVSDSNLVSIVGGKWTTYRKMAEEVVDKSILLHNYKNVRSRTKNLPIHGNVKETQTFKEKRLNVYGSDAKYIKEFEESNILYSKKIHVNYPFTAGQIVWAVRYELARTLEDVLARRVRLLFLDAKAAIESSRFVAKVMAKELNKDATWIDEQNEEFKKVAEKYVIDYYYE